MSTTTIHKGNRIEIVGTDQLEIKINGQRITVESTQDASSFSSPQAFGEFTSPAELARAVVDTQSALDSSEILLRNPGNLDIRRNLAELSDAERDNLRGAVFLLKERGEYDKYIKFHGFTNNLGHSGPAFFAWHRVFLRKFELELQQSDQKYETVTLPYWDYTSANVDERDNSRIWRDDFFGTNGVVKPTWRGEDGTEKTWTLPGYTALFGPVTERVGIHRGEFSLDTRFVDPEAFNEALRKRDYRLFQPAFEGIPHAAAHVRLGGDQRSFATAVNDPFFMFLHCNVDRMWSKWQQLMKNQWLSQNPGKAYPADQLATDYFWDESDKAHTAPDAVYARGAAKDRHNLENVMWPWDASESDANRKDSKLIPDAEAETYKPIDVLDHVAFGYNYDELDPTGFQE